MVPCIYVYLDFSVFFHFQYGFELMCILCIPCFGYADWMDFYGFADGACHHTLSLALAAWVLYNSTHDLVSSGVVCIGPMTNNIGEYQEVIGLLTEDASLDIHDLVVFMDSQLVVFHLNHVYTIRNPVLLHLFWRVCLLEISFECITYRHIPRADNTVAYLLVNYILDWYITHS